MLAQAVAEWSAGECPISIPRAAKERAEPWTIYQDRRPSLATVRKMFRGPCNLGLVMGRACGNGLALDCDSPTEFDSGARPSITLTNESDVRMAYMAWAVPEGLAIDDVPPVVQAHDFAVRAPDGWTGLLNPHVVQPWMSSSAITSFVAESILLA